MSLIDFPIGTIMFCVECGAPHKDPISIWGPEKCGNCGACHWSTAPNEKSEKWRKK